MEKFIPVIVNRGRKFRGECYLIEGEYTYTRGYVGSGVDPYQCINYVKVWCPSTKTTAFVNETFPQDREVSAEVLEADYRVYAESIIADTISWCKSKSGGSDERKVVEFARNVVRKHHKDLLALFDEKYGTKTDVSTEVGSTLRWAMSLGYRSDKAVRIALRALTKRGVTSLEGFNSAWRIHLDLRGLGKYAA